MGGAVERAFARKRSRPNALKRLIKFVAVGGEFLLHLTGGRKDGEAVIALHGIEQFRSGLPRNQDILRGEMEVVEKEGDKSTRQLRRFHLDASGGSRAWVRIQFHRRHMGAGGLNGKAGNGLRFAIVRELKILFFEVSDDFAVVVPHHDAHEDDVDTHLERRGRVARDDFLVCRLCIRFLTALRRLLLRGLRWR